MQNLICSNHYIRSSDDYLSLHQLMKLFNDNIKPDGVRNRAYLKLNWDRSTDTIQVAHNQNYFQSADSNIVDGGKIRQFAVMDKQIMELSVMQSIIHNNMNIIREFTALKQYQELTLGLHFIQYKVNKYGASYSSPDCLHRDDEPLVFVHLLSLSDNALGGDNLIADLKTKEITNVIRLENPLDTLMLTRDYYHAVTALGSRDGEARRDVLLFTVEPSETQLEEVA